MLSDDDIQKFHPDVAKLIAAFAFAAQFVEMDEEQIQTFFQTGLDIYKKGRLDLPVRG